MLVDADEANNPVSWQWVAGCGADPAPYFRVFNPELQSARFDPDGVYVTRWLGSGTRHTMPAVIDLAATRKQALAAYAQMRDEGYLSARRGALSTVALPTAPPVVAPAQTTRPAINLAAAAMSAPASAVLPGLRCSAC